MYAPVTAFTKHYLNLESPKALLSSMAGLFVTEAKASLNCATTSGLFFANLIIFPSDKSPSNKPSSESPLFLFRLLIAF